MIGLQFNGQHENGTKSNKSDLSAFLNKVTIGLELNRYIITGQKRNNSRFQNVPQCWSTRQPNDWLRVQSLPVVRPALIDQADNYWLARVQ